MAYIFLILGILCLAYFLGISLYAGFSVAFGIVWLVLGIAGVTSFFLTRHLGHLGVHMPSKVRIFLTVLVAIGGLILAGIEGVLIVQGNQAPKADAQYMIVLGAKVRGKTISLALQKRLDTAFHYWNENKETHIIVSGGKGPGEDIPEAQAMSQYLVKRGVPTDCITEENRSTNTEENIRFSREIIENDEASVVLITNGYHVFRAKMICRKQGMTNVSGCGAPTPFGLHINSYAREAVAVMKDFVVGNI